jgi:membrane associated rhomboid family serine protease
VDLPRVWFLYQFIEANSGLFSAGSAGGVAFFAHVCGFLFGFLLTLVLYGGGRVTTSADALRGVP